MISPTLTKIGRGFCLLCFMAPKGTFQAILYFEVMKIYTTKVIFFLWSSGGYSSFQSQACKIHPSLGVVFVKKVQRKLDKLFRPIDL